LFPINKLLQGEKIEPNRTVFIKMDPSFFPEYVILMTVTRLRASPRHGGPDSLKGFCEIHLATFLNRCGGVPPGAAFIILWNTKILTLSEKYNPHYSGTNSLFRFFRKNIKFITDTHLMTCPGHGSSGSFFRVCGKIHQS
jgi:hypothetical protein